MDNITDGSAVKQSANIFKIKVPTISSDKSDSKSPMQSSSTSNTTSKGVMRKVIFKTRGISLKRIVTTNEVQFYKNAIDLRNTLERVSKQCNSYKELIDKALNLPDNDELRIAKLEKVLKFVLSRVDQLGKKYSKK